MITSRLFELKTQQRLTTNQRSTKMITFQRVIKSLCRTLVGFAILVGSFVATPATAVEITLLYPIAVGGPLEKVINGLVADFESLHPSIDVDAVYAGGYKDVRVAAQASIESGNPPAVALLQANLIFELIEEDLIMPFDNFVKTAEDKKWLNSFSPGFMMNGRTADGKTWGIPFQRSTAVQVWNKDLFKQAGLDPDYAPQTWDELVQIASQVQQKSDASWGIGIHSSSSWMFQSLAIQSGVTLSKPDGKGVNFSHPAAIEALKWYADLSLVHKVQAPGVIPYGSLNQAFVKGKFAIAWQSTGSLTGLRKNTTFDLGVSMLPRNKRRGAATGGANLYLFSGAPEVEQRAAYELVKFLTQPSQAARWTLATGYVAPTQEAWETDLLKKYVAVFDGASVARDQLEFVDREFSTYKHGRVYGLLNKAVQEALTGQNEPEVIMKRIQREADAILAR
jgi:sn-glycerol 3-phosphate transport system substrate-binding protein